MTSPTHPGGPGGPGGHILILFWIKPNQGQNTSPWAWHCWTPGLVFHLKVNKMLGKRILSLETTFLCIKLVAFQISAKRGREDGFVFAWVWVSVTDKWLHSCLKNNRNNRNYWREERTAMCYEETLPRVFLARKRWVEKTKFHLEKVFCCFLLLPEITSFLK